LRLMVWYFYGNSFFILRFFLFDFNEIISLQDKQKGQTRGKMRRW